MTTTKILSTQTTGREVLTAARTYYVRPDGNDSFTGRTNVSGTNNGAFLTIQKAWDVLSGLDLSTYAGTIQVASGTYTGGLSIDKAPLGGSAINIYGDLTTPSNVVISTSSYCVDVTVPCNVNISGFKFTSSAAHCVFMRAMATVSLAIIEWGAAVGAGNCHIRAYLGKINITGNQAISGAAYAHYLLTLNGILEESGKTITLSGTLDFTYFVQLDLSSILSSYTCVYTGGTITGNRYIISNNSVCNTYGGGASYFPGDVAGAVATGGVYA